MEQQELQFIPVAPVSDLVEGKGKAYEVKGRLIAFFLRNGQVHAIDDACPHMGASLADGNLCGDLVSCQWHGWRFNITNGVWADAPKIKIGSYPVKVENGVVFLSINW